MKDVRFEPVDAELVVKPNLPVLGPKLGAELGEVRAALAAGDFDDLGDGRFRVGEHELGPDEVLVERAGKEGWAVAAEAGVTVALDTHVDDELDRERRVYELIRRVNALRKDSGLALSDRITLTIPAARRGPPRARASGSRRRRSRSRSRRTAATRPSSRGRDRRRCACRRPGRRADPGPAARARALPRRAS